MNFWFHTFLFGASGGCISRFVGLDNILLTLLLLLLLLINEFVQGILVDHLS